MFDLTGQTAIVTGGSRGIGRAIVERLAAAGAAVAIADVKEDKAREVAAEIGRTCFAVPTDITSVASVEKAVADVLGRRGQIDILVNNAGIAGKAAPIEEQTDKDWADII